MKKLVNFFIILHTAMLLITGFGVWIILKLFFPEMLINTYIIIPLFFYVLGLVSIFQFRLRPREESKVINTYMFLRALKIFTSFVFIIIYWIFDKPNLRTFAIIFIIFYLINLIWETYIYIWMEKYMKHKKDQEKPPKERIEQ